MWNQDEAIETALSRKFVQQDFHDLFIPVPESHGMLVKIQVSRRHPRLPECEPLGLRPRNPGICILNKSPT